LNPHLPGGSLPFPEQLSDFNISNIEPDERPGFFQHHTIELSWERPDNYEFITCYIITLENAVENNPQCGTTATFTAEPVSLCCTVGALQW